MKEKCILFYCFSQFSESNFLSQNVSDESNFLLLWTMLPGHCWWLELGHMTTAKTCLPSKNSALVAPLPVKPTN